MIIDRKVLKVLAEDTRMNIIKELSNGSRTPSDLSRKLNKSSATIVEHLDILCNSGLVRKIENSNRKWVFYALTDRCVDIISNKSRGLVIILAISLVVLVVGGSFLGFIYSYQAGTFAAKAPASESEKGGTLPANKPEFPYVLAVLIAIGIIGMVYIAKKTKFKLNSMKKTLFAILLFVLMLGSFSPLVKADGIIIPPRPPFEPVEENEQIAAINYQNGLEKMIIAVNFDMKDMSEAAWIFPVPADPNKVVIDVVKSFPQFYGYDVVQKARSDIDDIVQVSQLTQIYPIFQYFFYTWGMYAGRVMVEEKVFAPGITGVPSVTVYEHLEKEGITTEIVTARTGEALYWYLNNRGYNLPRGSTPVLDDYIGKDYTFVISWVSSPTLVGGEQYPYRRISPYIRQPGIFVTFPTDKVYFPMMPTSVYGSKRIPIRIYLLGFVTPEVSGEVKTYTTTGYYAQENFNTWDFKEFFGDTKSNGYTRVDIYVPSKYLTNDLWFKQEAPAKASYALAVYSTISKHWFLSEIAFILGVSAITGAVTGLIVFGDWRKYALIGLANLFSIIGLAIAITFARTKKLDELFKRRLKQEGLIVISADRRKLAFVVIFSIGFLIIGALIGVLLKAPLS